MKKKKTNTEIFRNKIISIVCLTNIPALVFLPIRYDQAIGWIAGSVASILNFYWLSCNVTKIMKIEIAASKLKSYKLFYLRYLALAVYSVLVVILLKPDIVIYGIGLVSVQLSIYGYHLYELTAHRGMNSEDN